MRDRFLYVGRPGLYVDNFEANAGSGGNTFKSDDIGGVHIPGSKIVLGANNSDDGYVATGNPMPVTGTITAVTNITNAITVNSHAVTNAGTFAVQVDGAALTSLQLLDDTVFVDDAAFTAATSKVIATGGIVTSDSVDAGDIGAFAMLANRQQKVTLYDSSGVELSVGGGTQYTEDAAAAANPVGNAIIVVRDDARGGSLTTTDGDNVALRGNNNGELYVKHTDSIAVTNAGLTELAAAINGSSQMDVNLAASNATITVASHAVTNAGTFAVQVDGNALTSLQLIDDAIVADDAAFTPATTKVMMAGFEADESSTDSVDEGDGGAARMTLDRKVITTPQPHTAGGLSTARSLDLDETEEDIKTSPGQVYGWNITNFRTSTVYVKFYNATAANVTVGTTTPLFTLAIPGNSSDDTMLSMMSTHGILFDTAISWAATTGLADNDTGAPSANDVAGTVWYK